MGATGNDNLDLTFFTNDENGSLLERFRRVLKSTRYFDVLVGYFRASGFYNLYRSLEDVEKIRVIVGLKLDEHTWDIYRHAREGAPLEFRSSHKIREQYRTELRDDVQGTSLDTRVHLNQILITPLSVRSPNKLLVSHF